MVELHDDFLRVPLQPGHADFHLRWLRHNCELDRHPLTRERTNDSADLPDRLAVAEAILDDDVLRIRWLHDQRTSRYPLSWLREHAYAIDRPGAPPPPSDVNAIELVGDPSTNVDTLVAKVFTHGVAIVRHDSAAPEDETEAWIAAITQRGLRTTSTHFGRIEDLRTDNTTNANTDQLGYTDAGIQLHTDQPFLDHPPRFQMLQAIRRADRGGENTVADGRAAFAYLASLDAEAAQRLLSTPVRFHRKQAQFEREVISPIVTFLDGAFRVRSSYFTVAPYKLPFAEMSAWYRAHDAYVRILRDPRYHYQFRLDPGDVLLYDNHRMLHGRSAFAGPRWVRGVYFDVTEDG